MPKYVKSCKIYFFKYYIVKGKYYHREYGHQDNYYRIGNTREKNKKIDGKHYRSILLLAEIL